MKIKYNKIRYALGILFIFSFIISFPALAQNFSDENGNGEDNNINHPGQRDWVSGMNGTDKNQRNQKPEGENTGEKNKTGQNICQRISDMSTQMEQRLSQRKKTPENQFENWQEKAGQKDDELAKTRSAWDANRTAQFAKLEARATTDNQKQAVADFKVAVKSAIAARRAAVDTAIAAFREGVKSLIASRKEDVSSNFTAFSDEVKAAFDSAKSDCASGKDPATIRTNLRNAIQAAKAKFHSNKIETPKIGGNIQPLIDARRAAVQKAFSDFKSAMEKARTELKKAFPEDE
jgi:hypothetical protein